MKFLKLLPFIILLTDFFNMHVVQAKDRQSSDSAGLTTLLKSEFIGAYPENPPSSEKIHSIELTAAETAWGLVPPYSTRVWTYNGSVPGPVIRIRLGDTLKVTLHNNLPQPTTIHWHGVRVPNAMDGVPGVTQPPVNPGESFTYRFTPKDPGTYWFHPHLNAAEQIERGLHGVLIVENPAEPKYSQDMVWVLDDWLLEKGAKIHAQFVTGHDLMHDGRWGNVLTVNGRYQPAIPVKAGERLRIRLVNVANGRVFAPELSGLSPVVIAVDGMPVAEPFPLRKFLAAPGNRIDVDVVIPKTAAGKSFAVTDVFGGTKKPLATLQAEPESLAATPDFPPPKAKHFPNWQTALEAPIAQEFLLNAKRGGPYGITWNIDHSADPKDSNLELPAGRFQRLRIRNESYRLHPMHLHGQFFKLLAVDGRPVEENFWRDTLLIGPQETADIGLVAIDKGSWAFHCHILEHAEAGMMRTLAIR
ncbi:MAG: multicopper oxidase family protein [Gammaproteobacteria bacterium]